MTKEQEIQEILQWLKDHDYIAIKYVLGEYVEDDTTYVEYLDQRRIKKTRLKELIQSGW